MGGSFDTSDFKFNGDFYISGRGNLGNKGTLGGTENKSKKFRILNFDKNCYIVGERNRAPPGNFLTFLTICSKGVDKLGIMIYNISRLK